MVMIITDAIFIQSSRTGWLYPPQQAFLDEQIERVVNGLTRNRSEFRANFLGHIIRRAVWSLRHCAQNRQPLCSHLHSVISQLSGSICLHTIVLEQFWTM
jgi:hypothetical protein